MGLFYIKADKNAKICYNISRNMPDPYLESVEEGQEGTGESLETPRPESVEKIEKKLPVEEEILDLEKKLTEKKKELEKVKKLEGAVEKAEEKPAFQPAPHAPFAEEELTKEEKLSLDQIKFLGKEEQLNVLIKTALEKGLQKSIKIARALNNAYVLDKFHDTLVDQLYKELLEKGKLKEG